MTVGRRCLFWWTLVLTLGLATAGCWDAVPAEEVAFSNAVGLDLASPKQQSDEGMPAPAGALVVTHLIARPEVLGQRAETTGGSVSLAAKPFVLISEAAGAVEGVRAEATAFLSRRIRVDFVQVLVLGEELARQGASPAVHWALRQRNLRPTTFLVVAVGTAQRLLDAQPSLDPLPADSLRALLQQARRSGLAWPVTVLDFGRWLLSPTRDPVAPLVERSRALAEPAEPGAEQAPLWRDRSASDLENRLLGLALFRGDRMVGRAEGAAARGLLLMLGEFAGTVVVPAPVPGQGQRLVAAVITRCRSRLEPTVVGERLTVGVQVTARALVQEVQDLGGVHTPQVARALTRRLEEALAGDVRAAWALLQQTGADAAGIAEQLYRRDPRAWAALRGRWLQVYRAADLKVAVRVELAQGTVYR